MARVRQEVDRVQRPGWLNLSFGVAAGGRRLSSSQDIGGLCSHLRQEPNGTEASIRRLTCLLGGTSVALIWWDSFPPPKTPNHAPSVSTLSLASTAENQR